jgi:phospholipid transport system substrate-binding protein
MTTILRSFLALAICAAPIMSMPAHAADPGPAAGSASQGVTPANVPAPTPAEAAMGPQDLMQKVAQELLDDLNANREAARKDPALLRSLVDRHLLPHFDTDYAARLVLGPHWKTATPEQRKRFVEAFYQSLLANYGDALLEFTADRMTILPYKGDPNATTATVRTEVKRSNGTPVPVNYSLRKTPQGWKAWDVTIEGISYVKNFRTDFGAEINEKGLDAVIERLESQNSKPTASSASAQKS